MDGTGTAIYLFRKSLPLTAGAENINNTFKYLAKIQRLSAATFFPDIRFVRVPRLVAVREASPAAQKASETAHDGNLGMRTSSKLFYGHACHII